MSKIKNNLLYFIVFTVLILSFLNYDKLNKLIQASENKAATVKLDLGVVTTDGKKNTRYVDSIKPTDSYNIHMKADQDGYLSLWHISSSGNFKHLYPKAGTGKIVANQIYSAFEKDVKINTKNGTDSFFLLWSKQQKDQPNIQDLSSTNLSSNQNLRQQIRKIEQTSSPYWKTHKISLSISEDSSEPPPTFPRLTKAVSSRLMLKGYSGKVYLLAMGANTGKLAQANNDAAYFTNTMVSLFNIPQGYYRNRNRNDATLRNFYADIAWLRSHVTSNDTVIVYFSGHGTKVPNRDGKERDGQDEAIKLLDAELIDDHFSREMNTLPTKHVIAFIDSCFSAGLSKSGTNTFGRRLKYYNTNPSTKGFLVSASSEYNPSYEHPKYGGEFTNSLMDELIGRNNSRNKGKTLRTIIKNAYKRLRIKGGSIQNFIHPSNILDKIYLSH